jgi:hypothetical protein
LARFCPRQTRGQQRTQETTERKTAEKKPVQTRAQSTNGKTNEARRFKSYAVQFGFDEDDDNEAEQGNDYDVHGQGPMDHEAITGTYLVRPVIGVDEDNWLGQRAESCGTDDGDVEHDDDGDVEHDDDDWHDDNDLAYKTNGERRNFLTLMERCGVINVVEDNSALKVREQDSEKLENIEFVIDTGCRKFNICSTKEILEDVRPTNTRIVGISGAPIKAEALGQLPFVGDTLYFPEADANLISVPQLLSMYPVVHDELHITPHGIHRTAWDHPTYRPC